ncbi:MAG: hypothetical protein HY237_08215 [Acidobacteria bacterium]|nr:hypothetical protein [Acidobacteriota bacterium]
MSVGEPGDEATARIFDTNPHHPGIAGFLQELFQAFEQACLVYAVAGNYDALPAHLGGGDLAILVNSADVERAYQVLTGAAHSCSAKVFRIDQEFALWTVVLHLDPLWVLRVDVAPPDSLRWRGMQFLDLGLALRRRIQEKGVWRLHAEDVVFMQFCRGVMCNFRLREECRLPILNLYRNRPKEFEQQLAEIFGRGCAARLVDVCGQEKFESLATLGRRLRRAVIWRSFLRRPLKTTRDILTYVGWRCREYIRPNGLMVAVLGPDGSGKSTLIQALQRDITRQLHFGAQVHHWRPGLLPSLSSLLARPYNDAPVTNPRGRKPNGWLLSLISVTYYFADFVLGYWALVRPRLGRQCLAVIFDRYFYDYLIDQIYYRISLPQWVIRFYSLLIPRPDLVIFLVADPKTIYDRKPELSLEEIQRQSREIHHLAERLDNAVWVRASGSIECSAQQMFRSILNGLERRLESVAV